MISNNEERGKGGKEEKAGTNVLELARELGRDEGFAQVADVTEEEASEIVRGFRGEIEIRSLFKEESEFANSVDVSRIFEQVHCWQSIFVFVSIILSDFAQ